jgi:hypothetical protein
VEVGLDNFLDTSLVMHKVHLPVSHSPVTDVCPARLAAGDYSLERPAEEEHVMGQLAHAASRWSPPLPRC